ncbi:MAG: 2-methylthioadenine synthetase, partial [Thaumarchaeota archaeon]|nr:2-methylthioadenine synthetase [Nitrososphaerota archaeon]
IVGFPSENKADFEDTIQLLEETRPDVVNLSKYSQRPGTEAATWKQIGVSEVRRRSKQIYDLSRKISHENNLKWIGWTGNVLFNEKIEDGIRGRNFAYKPIFVKDYVEVGERHQVTITNVTDNSLLGAIIR